MGCHENDKREGEEASKYFGSYLAFKVFKIFTIGGKRHCNGSVGMPQVMRMICSQTSSGCQVQRGFMVPISYVPPFIKGCRYM